MEYCGLSWSRIDDAHASYSCQTTVSALTFAGTAGQTAYPAPSLVSLLKVDEHSTLANMLFDSIAAACSIARQPER